MPKLDLDTVREISTTGYPGSYANDVAGRFVRRIGDATGLTDFGASHVVLRPGAASAQRHWHEEEDELVVMLWGDAVLVDDNGRTPLAPGDIAVFPMNDGNGHHIVNESDADCAFLAIGRDGTGVVRYPDIDLIWNGAADRYEHEDGRPYG